jgi:hypothetical protein
MRVLRTCLGVAAFALVAWPTAAMAKPLAIASVTPQGVACIFTSKCAVTATDTVHYFQLFGNGGNGKLLVRTYPGLAGTRAAGLTGYSLFIDMHGATALGTPNCVDKLTIDVGPLASVNYAGPPAEVFVVAASAGSGISSATQTGSKVTFAFAKPICPNPGRMTESLYFGFAAKGAPVAGTAEISASLHGSATVKIRVPQH